MSVEEIYKQTILDHARHSQGSFVMENPDLTLEASNPLCGDRLTLFVNFDQDRVQALSFQASGCVLLKASCSMMVTLVEGTSFEEIKKLFHTFHRFLLTGSGDLPKELYAFSRVHTIPMRAKCVSLPWHTLTNAL